jgi:hypothetical protein
VIFFFAFAMGIALALLVGGVLGFLLHALLFKKGTSRAKKGELLSVKTPSPRELRAHRERAAALEADRPQFGALGHAETGSGAPKDVPLIHDRVSPQDAEAYSAAWLAQISMRRSIRAFSGEPVPRRCVAFPVSLLPLFSDAPPFRIIQTLLVISVVENLVSAAGTAPSGANCQPWSFAVVSSLDVKVGFLLSLPLCYPVSLSPSAPSTDMCWFALIWFEKRRAFAS